MEGDATPAEQTLADPLDVSAELGSDDPTRLRGDLWTADRLAEHAVEVARAHAAPILRALPGPLRERFVESRTRIREAYALLAKANHAKREPSPAEEWLLDNWHVIEEQLREVEEDLPSGYLITLPRIRDGRMAGYPCVYGLCLEYLRHSDARVDMDVLTRYVRSYQTVRNLTMGEVWAIPIMLRIGLILTVGAIAAEEAHSDHRARADAIAERLLAPLDSSEGAAAVNVLHSEDERPSAPLLVHLLRRLHEHEAPSGRAFDWIRNQCTKLGVTPEELARRQHLRQAADQVSVGNSITSMRAIGALDWNDFFSATSAVEEVLMRDPGGSYPQTARGSRDAIRHAVEEIARRSDADERKVSRLAIELAKAGREKHGRDAPRAQAAYYLVRRGRRVLERRVDYRPKARERFERAMLASPTLAYLGLIAFVTIGLAGGFVALAMPRASVLSIVVGTLALVFVTSDVAVTVANAVVTWLLSPRSLPKLSSRNGIRPEHTTLVIVPAMIDSVEGVEKLLRDLEIRALANMEENLYFALVTDYVDARDEKQPSDAVRLSQAERGIEALNLRYPKAPFRRFHLFHRRRLSNPAQGCWMGWERKRGKLHELNQLLVGEGETTFDVVTAPPELRRTIKYVITLDADTSLPRESACKLVATIAHPLNRARVKNGVVTEGYAIVQPRVGTDPVSARQSRFARVMAGPAGIDPYTNVVSDVYQDLFAEGAYVGKGIYDVAAFHSALEDRVPENTLLSHDLFEGIHARTALATDIELLDDQPSSYSAWAARHHRWVRGDWQLLPWLGRATPRRRGDPKRNDISAIGRWKLVDNLRRSVVSPALVVLLTWGWFGGLAQGLLSTVLVFVALFAPAIGSSIVTLTRATTAPTHGVFRGLWGDLRWNVARAFVSLALLLDRSVVSLDAIARTLFRLVHSRKNLLSWRTSAAVESSAKKQFDSRLLWESAGCLAIGVILAGTGSASALVAAPILLTWALTPLFTAWLGRPPRERAKAELTIDQRRKLRLCARKTWHFFEAFVTAEDNWLPPDNYQEEPRGVIAHRTSPTNIGLYLMSVCAAHDFGFISWSDLTRRFDCTLRTIDRLEKHDGHLLNWYDTTTLDPLEPRYVSTVDSGNFVAYLVTLRAALGELPDRDLIGAPAFVALEDAVDLAFGLDGRAALLRGRFSAVRARRRMRRSSRGFAN